MQPEVYLHVVLSKYQVSKNAELVVRAHFQPLIKQWANTCLSSVTLSGSAAKGTANKGSTDVDLFISLLPTTQETLKDIYNSLYKFLFDRGYKVRRQDVSIGVTYQDLSVDLVPGKRQSGPTDDHSLYRSKKDTWTKTNVRKHIQLVQNSGRLREIRLTKLWRRLRGLEFPSFYLELSVLEALHGKSGNILENMVSVLTYLRDELPDRVIIDPSNTNNRVSDDLTAAEKRAIAEAASKSLGESWQQLVW